VRLSYFVFPAVFLLSGCTAMENDLNKGIAYGTNAERITRKINDKNPARVPSAINAYLWRAALDTVGNIPLVTANPRSGRIETEWHSAPTEPDERSKLMIWILDDELRRDTLRVAVATQVREKGAWQNAPVQALTAHNFEELILTKARELRRQ
jgi:Domain of unknown function (DUF3576)